MRFARFERARSSLWRAFSAVVALRPVSWLALKLATAVDRPLMRQSRGRLRLSFVIPCVLLETRGVRTGLKREIPLLCVAEEAGLLVVGSNGGADRDPAWCTNLRASPRVRCGYRGSVGEYVAEELHGTDRERAWTLAVQAYPGYRRYQARVARRIPVFRLRPQP